MAPPRDLRGALKARLRVILVEGVRAALAPRRVAWEDARAAADDLRAALARTERTTATTLARLDRSPFTGAMTVHAAHARDPRVQAIFAAHGLPRCTDCAVGADETLAEAAFGEGMSLAGLLAELDALG